MTDERIRERAKELMRELGIHSPAAMRAIEFSLTAERDAERERCCKDVCEWCAGLSDFLPVEKTEDGWIHFYGKRRATSTECRASAIRSRVAAQEKK